jgi:hypothetical protein
MDAAPNVVRADISKGIGEPKARASIANAMGVAHKQQMHVVVAMLD